MPTARWFDPTTALRLIDLSSDHLMGPGTGKAARRVETAVQMNHPMTTGTLVQIVDILGNDGEPRDPPGELSSAIARWAEFGLAASTIARRHSYHPHTNAGSMRKALAVAKAAGANNAHKPFKASQNVGVPLSAETPAPVNTTT